MLRRLRRASLAALRREVEPAEQAALGRFLPAWHGIDRRATLREALVPLQGLPLPVSLWESRGAAAPRARLPARLRSTRSAPPARSSGSAPASTASPSTSARTRRVLGRPAGAPPPEGEAARRDPRGARRERRVLVPDLLEATGLEPEVALPALWELVWAGEVTNDAWTPLRAGRRYATPRTRQRTAAAASRARARHAGHVDAGPLVARPTASSPARPDRRALAELLLERQGIVTRDGVRGEGIAGGYGAVYGELRALETLGVCRRGYFVEGLGGAQFALAGRRRAAARAARGARIPSRSCSRPPIRRSRTAPRCRGRSGPGPAPRASPAHRSSCSAARRRSSSSAAAGRSCRCASPDEEWLRPALAALVAHVRGGGAKRLAVERFDGRPVVETEVMPLLVEAGFLAGPRRAVLRP